MDELAYSLNGELGRRDGRLSWEYTMGVGARSAWPRASRSVPGSSRYAWPHVTSPSL